MSDGLVSVYSQLATAARAIGNSVRIRLLEFLSQGEKTVEELASLTDTAVANVSHHLQILHREGLVIRRRDGMWIKYRIRGDEVVLLLSTLRSTTLAVHADLGDIVRRLPHDPMGHVPITRDEALILHKKGLALFLDVRPRDEFQSGHVTGAKNIPLEELESRIDEIEREHEIIVYCRGPFCVMSSMALSILSERGYKIRRIEDGFPEWKALGLPVESTADITRT